MDEVRSLPNTCPDMMNGWMDLDYIIVPTVSYLSIPNLIIADKTNADRGSGELSQQLHDLPLPHHAYQGGAEQARGRTSAFAIPSVNRDTRSQSSG